MDKAVSKYLVLVSLDSALAEVPASQVLLAVSLIPLRTVTTLWMSVLR